MSQQFWGVDAFLARVYPLNADGSFKVTSTTVYEGLEIDGPRTFDLTPAESGLVVNIGNGRVRDTIYRAPREASRAELRVGYDQFAIKAALTGVKVVTNGEIQQIGRLTNRQGSEVDACMMLIQRGHDENGLTRFKTYVIPKSKAVPVDSSMNDNASEDRYAVTISNSKKEAWGEVYTIAKHGFTDTGYLEWLSEGIPHMVAWKADGIEETFLLPPSKPAIETAKMKVYNFNYGFEYTSVVTKAVNQLVFNYSPAQGTVIVCVYEYDE